MKSYNQVMGLPRQEEFIGTGETAIMNTIKKMKDIIMSSSRNPYIREWAQKIVAGIEVNDLKNEANAIHNFVRDNVRYTRDPFGYEYLQTPPVLLEDIRLYQAGQGNRPIGDCDDMTMLSLSLLKSIGFNVAIKVVSFHESGRLSHVYGLVKIGYEWVPIDCVRTDKQLGWESPLLTRAVEVQVL